jgi:hypothetical protein
LKSKNNTVSLSHTILKQNQIMKVLQKLSMLFLLLAVIGIEGCDNGNDTPGQTELPVEELPEIRNGDLTGTQWKLAGIYDMQTGILKELEPKECTDCYTLTFGTDSTAHGQSVVNQISVNFTYPPGSIIWQGTYILETGDPGLFCGFLTQVTSYELSFESKKYWLKFFDGTKQKYLLYYYYFNVNKIFN